MSISHFLKKGYRPFWAAFLLSLLVLGGALAICCSIVFSAQEQPVDTAPDLPVGVGKSCNLLLIGCREKNQSPQRVVLLRFSGLDQKAHIQNVDLTKTATVKLYTDTLLGQYNYGGPDQLLQAAQGVLGVTLDGWVRIDETGLCKIAQQFPLVEISLAQEVITGRYRFPSGLSVADAPRQADLFFSSETGGAMQLVAIQLEQVLQMEAQEAAELLFHCADTSLSAYDLERNRSLFSSITEVTQDSG